MSAERQRTELFVGLFVLIGFGFIAGMIVIFGSRGQQLRHGYEITVELPNADGLIKNSAVLLAGAPIGQVAEPPALLGANFHVSVKLRIQDNVHIPRQATFLVNSSGLMGDKFVNVSVPANFDPKDVLPPGANVVGASHGGGFEALTDKGNVVIGQLETELNQLETMTTTLNTKLFNQENLQNLQATIANLKSTTQTLDTTTRTANAVIEKAGVTVESANTAIKTAGGAAGDLRLAIGDVRKTSETATKTIESADLLIKKASTGEGALSLLINDRKMADDLKNLVANLRHSGVLFYKDRPPAPAPAPGPGPRR